MSRCILGSGSFYMNEKPHILVVDGNPLVTEGCRRVQDLYMDALDIETANNSEEAFLKINSGIVSFNVVILEVSLIPYEQEKIYSGIELAILARKLNRECKIILLAATSNDYNYHETIARINPDGYIVKGNMKSIEFLQAIRKVMDGKIFYCALVLGALARIKARGIYLDGINLRIIRLLAKGVKTKSLPLHVPLGISAIDKRKAQIKEIFDIQKGTDEDIIRQARINGFI